ncbi:hypothetical protein OsJ_07799 [Oryza sativa Japonica Group]|uniref:Uncharacterized protein n=1 Tax=Oryza sativa subsp. japonica TaxID=39947 RepID=B9F1H1_ORYSJ|nr:hypothetical protein OsJ_07799 [Oryza sativa Japonica Group]
MRREGEEEWEEVVAGAEEAVHGAPVPVAEEEEEYRVVFWSPPTGDEVRAAFTSIEELPFAFRVFGDPFRAHSYETEEQSALSTSVHSSSGNSSGSDDWIEPAAYALNSTALLTREHRNVLDAFRLLQKDPNVQILMFRVFGDPFRAHSYETEEQSALSTSVHSSSGNSSGSDDWIEPAAYALNSTALLTREHRNVLDAFRLLQKDPNVQKMVMSLSCDRAVWDAVMNNEAVQEFRRSFQDDKEAAGRKGNPGGPAGVLKWILGNTQAKIMEFMNNIMKIVNMLFHSDDDEAKPDLYTDAVKVSFMLSVFIFIVVAIARIK